MPRPGKGLKASRIGAAASREARAAAKEEPAAAPEEDFAPDDLEAALSLKTIAADAAGVQVDASTKVSGAPAEMDGGQWQHVDAASAVHQRIQQIKEDEQHLRRLDKQQLRRSNREYYLSLCRLGVPLKMLGL